MADRLDLKAAPKIVVTWVAVDGAAQAVIFPPTEQVTEAQVGIADPAVWHPANVDKPPPGASDLG